MLLDEFISSVQAEKDDAEKKKMREKEEIDMAHRVTGVLDPFVEMLASFNGEGDLTQKISASYTFLDEDGRYVCVCVFMCVCVCVCVCMIYHILRSVCTCMIQHIV